jgi:FKBP-type peptidyl-prolyl cis-trans isomerase FkpA
MHKFSAIAVTAVCLVACGQPDSVVISDEDIESAFETDDERIVYALGVVLGQNVGDSVTIFSLTPAERTLMLDGMRDALDDAPIRVEMELYGPQIQDLADRRMTAGTDIERAAAAEFADAIAAEAGAERTATGLVYVQVTPGDGAMPEAADAVRVHYHGTLRDGSVFDSSRERGTPAEFGLNQVIPCWTEGLQLMQVGETARLLCPPDIAYGNNSPSPDIPGGAALLFEIELIEILE